MRVTVANIQNSTTWTDDIFLAYKYGSKEDASRAKKAFQNAVKADALHLKNIGAAQSFMSSLNPMGCEAIKYADGETLTLTAMQINKYYYFLMGEYLK